MAGLESLNKCDVFHKGGRKLVSGEISANASEQKCLLFLSNQQVSFTTNISKQDQLKHVDFCFVFL